MQGFTISDYHAIKTLLKQNNMIHVYQSSTKDKTQRRSLLSHKQSDLKSRSIKILIEILQPGCHELGGRDPFLQSHKKPKSAPKTVTDTFERNMLENGRELS